MVPPNQSARKGLRAHPVWKKDKSVTTTILLMKTSLAIYKQVLEVKDCETFDSLPQRSRVALLKE